jgi:glycosyltransferase involved in cell wall biosynthesis
MPRFANMIAGGMRDRGHAVTVWECPVIFGDKATRPALRKWLGYIDQFLVFPWIIRSKLRKTPQDTVFVFTDQALGMWIPAVARRPHVVHCHDFLAQRSACGEFPMNKTGLTGRIYQALIRGGYRKGRRFVSVSRRTRSDLHKFLRREPESSEVIYNGLNYPFRPLPQTEVFHRLSSIMESGDASGVLLHVGGNQWYKNREGVVCLYAEYASHVSDPLPLWFVGREPDERLRRAAATVQRGRIRFLTDLSNEQVNAAYCLARVLVFPSYAEGFGWPIIEAMACGTPVLTTNDAPMSEVAGDSAVYVPLPGADLKAWAASAHQELIHFLSEPVGARSEQCIRRARQFSHEEALNNYEAAYLQAIRDSGE